jgi:2,3-dihydroxybenzoate-AMP ligase
MTSIAALEGFVPWPDELAARYRASGLWQGIAVGEMVARTAHAMPDKTALVHGEQRLSYAQLMQASQRLALGLHRAGLARTDRVVVQLPNGVDFVVAYLALNLIGAIPVMALRAHRHAEVRHFIRASGAVAYLVPGVLGNFDFRAMAAEMQAEFAGQLRHVWVAGEPLAGQGALRAMADAATQADALAAALAPLSPAPHDVSTMLLSGGTTSMSKLIPRTHDDYVLNARACSAVGGFDERTVFMAILPLGHNYNLASPGMLGVFCRGGTLVLVEGTGVDEVWATVERERVSHIAAVVPLITAWLNSDVPARVDHASLRVIQNGGARLPPELRRRLRSQLGVTPQEIYGTAEGLINMTRLDDAEPLLLESSGAPVLDEDEIRVVDDGGRDLPDGTPGELVTRGPYTIRGYYRAAEKNAEAFLPDGWYRMGDIVRKQGRHVFTEGRRKDMINRGGEKISCDEVENLILKHPAVKTAVLVAMPDPVFGEKACACVVCQPGASITIEELVAFLRTQQIASFKLPERLELMTELPVSPVGKILKRELRDIVAARVAPARGD